MKKKEEKKIKEGRKEGRKALFVCLCSRFDKRERGREIVIVYNECILNKTFFWYICIYIFPVRCCCEYVFHYFYF